MQKRSPAMSPIIQQRNAETIRMLKKMETDKLNKRVALALSRFTCAPASFSQKMRQQPQRYRYPAPLITRSCPLTYSCSASSLSISARHIIDRSVITASASASVNPLGASSATPVAASSAGTPEAAAVSRRTQPEGSSQRPA